MEIFSFKVILVGDGRVGKTSIRRQYMGKGFSKSHLMTIGADFAEKEIELTSHNCKVKFQIWDLAGQKDFKTIRKRFLSNSKGILVVYDITNFDSFRNISSWLEEVWQINNDIKIPIILIGNKEDLKEKRVVEKDHAKDYLISLKRQNPSIGTLSFIETSALSGYNIENCFLNLAKTLIQESNRSISF